MAKSNSPKDQQSRLVRKLASTTGTLLVGVLLGVFLIGSNTGNDSQKKFATGLLSGAALVTLVAALHRYQQVREFNQAQSDMGRRVRTLQRKLGVEVDAKSGLEQQIAQEQGKVAELTEQQSELAARNRILHAEKEQLGQSLAGAKQNLVQANCQYGELFEKLTKTQKELQDVRRNLHREVKQAEEQGFKTGFAKAQSDLTQQLQYQEQQAVNAIAQLEQELKEARAEVQAWEEEFDQQLLLSAEAQERELTEQLEMAFRAQYKQRVAQVNQAIHKATLKRCEKQREHWLAELQAELTRVVAERDRALQNIERYEQEFVGFAADMEQLSDTSLQQDLARQVEQLQDAIEGKNRRIERFQAKIEALEAPRLFPGGYEYHRGNILIQHALDQGIVLDALTRSRNTEAGKETYYFATRKPEAPREVLIHLNAASLKLQHQLDSKNPVQFSYDSETLTYKASVQIFEKRLSRDEIDRKWLKASKFKALVKDVCAFRVSANKGGSKSPTVRNILGAKLLEGEKFKLRRYDPSAGSRKDYWRVAPTWRSYHQAVAMAAEIESLILRRQREKSARNGAEFDWVYYIIDELDNTMSTLTGEVVADGEDEISAAKVVINAIAKAVKEGEHLQIGIILCTQTPNVRQLMKSEVIDKAFFNNLAQIVVEGNVFDYLASSTDQTKSAKLATDYRAVYDWCDKQNDTITDEARKYRPALFVNKGKREVIELPQLGEYGFDKLDTSKPYDFEEFNAYEYGEARSLDQALLMASKERVARISSPPAATSSHLGGEHQTGSKVDQNPVGYQNSQTGGNVAVAIDPKILATTDKAVNCPICGATLKPNGRGRGSYKGMRQLACRNKAHKAAMGSKTYYQQR